jgi:bifunctional NMN adenylyltransferase/nudix hydrolase
MMSDVKAAGAVIIGRFQPFHNGHQVLLQRALDIAHQVVVVLGSAHQARSFKNPFTWQERAAMIAISLTPEDQSRVKFVAVRDCYDDKRWAADVMNQATAMLAKTAEPGPIVLVGHEKDHTSYYLRMFPQWDYEAVELHSKLDATTLRRIYFGDTSIDTTQALMSTMLPAAIGGYLRGWSLLPEYTQIKQELIAIEHSKARWGSGPFITADAILHVNDSVLLIKRKHAPGAGLLALPGGFLEPHERILTSAIRELREETGVGLLDLTLENALRDVKVFDHPGRSLRGRTVTHAHYFRLKAGHLPEICAGDDACEAFWVEQQDLAGLEASFFEDHFHILSHFLHSLPEEQEQPARTFGFRPACITEG